jgi:hypothetical protein
MLQALSPENKNNGLFSRLLQKNFKQCLRQETLLKSSNVPLPTIEEILLHFQEVKVPKQMKSHMHVMQVWIRQKTASLGNRQLSNIT